MSLTGTRTAALSQLAPDRVDLATRRPAGLAPAVGEQTENPVQRGAGIGVATGRADRFQREVGQRLAGSSGGSPDSSAVAPARRWYEEVMLPGSGELAVAAEYRRRQSS
jgi:hypothetical protein